MSRHLLLDTCACIWMSNREPMADEAIAALNAAWQAGDDLYVCPFTAWEIGMLAARGRLTAGMSPNLWFERLVGTEGVRLSALSPAVLLASNALPGTPPRDPADRIIIATAREQGLTVVTRDRLILDYAEAGHVFALAC